MARGRRRLYNIYVYETYMYIGLCAATELPVTRPRLAWRSPAATFNWNPFWSVLNAAVPTRMDVNESRRTRLVV